jgi:hypothetical protein
VNGSNPLGGYLKARRQLVTLEAVGIPRGPRRRVPGLRREERALLAGISPDYYLRLEQTTIPRDRSWTRSPRCCNWTPTQSPTCQLAQHSPKQPPRPAVERVSTRVVHLINQLAAPIFIQGRFMDVLAANPLARALSPQFEPGVNLLRTVFLDPRDRQLHQDWDRATEESVSGLRAILGADLDDPRLNELGGTHTHEALQELAALADHDVRTPENPTNG